MIHQTKGVVFRFTRYGETSIIVTIFTEQFGLQSYIINGVRTKSSRSKIALYQPLTILELVVYHRENAQINRIREVRCYHPYHSIYQDVIKSSVAMFITEVINKTIREEGQSHHLCEFLISSLVTLDTMSVNVNNFHLIFLLKLSRFLGFGAQIPAEVLGARVTDPLIEEELRRMLSGDYLMTVNLTQAHRRELLDLLVQYYRDHSGFTGELKSLQVLREIFA